MFSFTSAVRYSETEETGNLSLTGIMNYLQDCSLFQSEALGVGPDYLNKHHRVWLLSGWQIVIDRYPKMFEKITVGTLPYKFSASLGWRNVFISDESGNCIVKANCPWVYMDTDTGRPVRPDETQIMAYSLEERIPMDYAPRKISLPENMEDCKPIQVLPHFIDTNHHVNNAQYVELAYGITDKTRRVKELRVEYKKQAHLGDTLYPRIGSKNDWEYVAFEDENENIYASVALHM